MTISSEFSVNLTPSPNDIDSILHKTWGNKSPIGKIHGLDTGQTKAVLIMHKGTPAGCAAIHILPWKELEFGSLAILSDYRGLGLLGLINEWRNETAKPFLEDGYRLTAYATVGSKVLHFIIATMESCTRNPCLPLNLAPGVVPVDLEKSKTNIDKSVLIPDDGQLNLNSTIQVSNIPKTIYGDPKMFPDIKKYLNGCEFQVNKITEENNRLITLPILMDIYHVRELNNLSLKRVLKEYSENKDKLLRVDVPMVSNYKEIISWLIEKRLFFAGMSIINNTINLSFLNRVPKEISQILKYLIDFPNKKISRFGEMILMVNKTISSQPGRF